MSTLILKESITIIIVDFKLFDDSNEYTEHIFFRRENRKIFTKAQQFYIIDLTKLPKELTETKHEWGALFKAKTKEELKLLMERSEEMKTAGEKLLALSADKEAREIAEAREYSQQALEMELYARENRGREQGREEGIAKVAKNMLARGTAIEIIAEDTGLSIAAIKEIQQYE